MKIAFHEYVKASSTALLEKRKKESMEVEEIDTVKIGSNIT